MEAMNQKCNQMNESQAKPIKNTDNINTSEDQSTSANIEKEVRSDT